jgi:hypothetical protein
MIMSVVVSASFYNDWIELGKFHEDCMPRSNDKGLCDIQAFIANLLSRVKESSLAIFNWIALGAHKVWK